MAEYGILVWRTGVKQTSVYYPNEFDLILNLDTRVEFTGKNKDDLAKIDKGKGILKSPGNLVLPEVNQTIGVERVGPKRKIAKSDLVFPTFIDRCITRISEKTKQEEINMAVERVKHDPRRQEITYRYVGSFLRSLYLTQCELIAYKNVLQTAYIDRVGMCVKRPHLEGVDRLLSQMQVINLLESTIGKVCKTSDKSIVNLSEVEDSTSYNFFLIEFPPEKLKTTSISATGGRTLPQTFKDVEDIERENKARRVNHYLLESENTDNKNYYADFEEEISTSLKDTTNVKVALTPYGSKSRFFHEMKIVIWKINNGVGAKNIMHNVESWSDVVRLPMRNFGIWSVLFRPLGQYFSELYSSKNLKILQQVEKKQDDFWKRWLDQVKFRRADEVEKIIDFAYGRIEKGCYMEQVIMFSYFETLGFLYNLVGRFSCVEVRERLFRGIFHKKDDLPQRWSPEKRKNVRRVRELDCDEYLENNLIFKSWNGQLLVDLQECKSLTCGFVYILRFAFGVDHLKIDPDDLESDMNLVLCGFITLEVFLERYVPPLSKLVHKAYSCDSSTTYGEILQLLYCYNLLLILLALFGEASFEKMDYGGFVFFKRYMKDCYFLTHIRQKQSHITTLKGISLSDILIYTLSGPLCEEYMYQYVDRFEDYDNEKRNNAWGEFMASEKIRFAEEKVKYGEKAAEWELKEHARLKEEKRQADQRYTLRNFLKDLFRDANYEHSTRSLKLKILSEVHCSRVNYLTMNVLLGSNCRGLSDITSVVFPVSAPHKSMMVITIYTKGLEIAEILSRVQKRFKRNFENIYQHVLIGIGPSDITYTETSENLKTKDRVIYKGLGPMQTRMIPYTSEDADGQAILIKSDKVSKGSKFFFMKISAVE
ncbi:VP2 [CHeRI orbivirus 2-2]|nr:VP2 [CHeRI orbivirus 2-2]